MKRGIDDGNATLALEKREVLIPPLALQGTLRIPANASSLVIFVHGSGSSRLSPRNIQVAEALNRSGFATLLFDLLKPREEDIVNRDLQVRMARSGYQKLLAERDRKMPPEKQQELMKLFHDIPVWQHMWFHNVQIEKNPLDLWMMQEILYQLQPDFVVETGTWRGGSALYWAYTLNGLGLEKSRVITVDIQNLNQTASTDPLWKKYVTFYQGSSTDPKIVADILKTVQGHKVVVTLDSDHSMRHVLNELHAYSPMVPSHSYLVVEDTHIDGVPTQPDAGPGPLAAVQKFLTEDEGKSFEQDLTREAFMMTFNPGGWLKKK